MAFLLGGSKPKTNAVKPDYTGLQIQTAVNTLPIPILFGRTKLAPNLIWSDDFKAIAHTQKQKGGKGGGVGSSTSTTYTYSTSVVMGLCEGPIAQVTTVWAGQTVSTLSGLGFTLYNGSGTQAPWGYLTSAHSDKALAYPWTAYIAQADSVCQAGVNSTGRDLVMDQAAKAGMVSWVKDCFGLASSSAKGSTVM